MRRSRTPSRNTFFVQRIFAMFVAGFTAISGTHSVDAKGAKFVSPEILVLGDSQLSFGSGKLLLDFFQKFDDHCKPHVSSAATRSRIAAMRTTMFGTRSTSLQSWVSTKGVAWRRMCLKDKTWGVNSSVWGHNSTPKRLYYQIGEGRNYQFCKRGQTPLQAMFRQMYYMPDLVFFYLIGNGAKRLASSAVAAQSDVEKLVAQLPMETKCVFMTTTPIHTKRRNKVRVAAQDNLRKAFAAHGNRCTFVSGLKPDAIAAIQGKARFFRRKKSGKVKDPFHPNAAATKLFLDLSKRDICTAVAGQLSRPVVIALPDKKQPASPRVDKPQVNADRPSKVEIVPAQHTTASAKKSLRPKFEMSKMEIAAPHDGFASATAYAPRSR